MVPALRQWLSLPRVRTPLLVGSMTRAAIIVVAFLSLRLMGAAEPDAFFYHGGSPHPIKILDNFQRFDAYWYLNVAREGYQYHGPQEQLRQRGARARETNITSFPLYPALIWLLGLVLRDLTISGLLISLACYFSSLLIFYRMVESESDDQTAGRAALYLSIYPLAFLYNAIYSEALFLLLSLLALKSARQGKTLASGLYGMGATLTRLSGVLLALPVAVEFLFAGRRRPDLSRLPQALVAASLVSAGWVLYFSYLRGLTGDFWVYFTAQQGWHNNICAPWTVIGNLFAPGLPRDPGRLMALGSLLFFIPLTVAGARRLRPSLLTYMVLGVLMPFSATTLLGLPRYLMVLFPAYLVMAKWGGRAPHVHLLIVISSCLLQAVLMVAWMHWKYSF